MHVMILGTRGIPANHGGFETFAEDLSQFLVARNHSVTVYCQVHQDAQRTEDMWHGVRRVLIPAADSALGTVLYDWSSVSDSSRRQGIVLTLGYNTGMFSILYRLRHLPSVMNMDGIEWKRKKWTWPKRIWLWVNEWAGARLANHLVADHPEILVHLQRHTPAKKITVIPYGADAVTSASATPLEVYGLKPKTYYLVIARAEPENSILEVVRAFSSERIDSMLVVLGKYSPDQNAYQKKVLDEASSKVKFLGAIYDREVVRSLRFYAKAYIHGHRVGGTNPSMVESLAEGNAIIAHDNRFNRWVAGEGALFFKGSDDLERLLYSSGRDSGKLSSMEAASRNRHREQFIKEQVLLDYEELLLRFAPQQ